MSFISGLVSIIGLIIFIFGIIGLFKPSIFDDKNKPDEKPSTRGTAAGTMFGAFIVMLIGGWLSPESKDDTKTTPVVEAKQESVKVETKAPETPTVNTEPPAPAKPTGPVTLTDAVSSFKDNMTDTTGGEFSPGAALLTGWAIKNMKWADLQKLPDSKYSLVMKDSDEQRGKKICLSGTVLEIQSEKMEGSKIYHAGIYDANMNIHRIVAIGSTGSIAADSRAKFCGVTIGKMDYPNSAGGVAHSVYLVGMFDLPENKK